MTLAFYSPQSDHPAREEATSLNNPSDGSEDQEEARDSADQSGEDFFFNDRTLVHSFIRKSLEERAFPKGLISSEQKCWRL